jgi:hypothetical protein
LALIVSSCGGGGASTPTTVATTAASASPSPSATATTTASSNAYEAAYIKAGWTSATTVSFTSCTMTYTTTGVPPFHNDYYLAPESASGGTVVAYTAVTKTALTLIAYPAPQSGTTISVNVCPTKASSTTATSGGPIGYTIAGEALFDPYEMDASTPALSDNASYSFTSSSGVAETAYFIDQCNSHTNGSTWHYHGVPTCLAATLDGTSGPSHLLGFALDGYPIYGGRDINGNVISVSQLDACNGITSPTPEFPNGAYHYVLPIGVTGKQSSLNCYTGVVSQSTLAAARRALCGGARLAQQWLDRDRDRTRRTTRAITARYELVQAWWHEGGAAGRT